MARAARAHAGARTHPPTLTDYQGPSVSGTLSVGGIGGGVFRYGWLRRIGGYCYPVGAIPVTHADWVQRFGDSWAEFARAKRRYDPAGILTPGERISGGPPA